MMGQFKGNKIENWSEEKILNILDLQYLSRNACKYLIHNLLLYCPIPAICTIST